MFAYFCVKQHVKDISSTIQAQVYERLFQADLGTAGVMMDGRDVILAGMVENYDTKLKAGRIALLTEGVRVVDNQLMVVPAPLSGSELPAISAPAPMTKDEGN